MATTEPGWGPCSVRAAVTQSQDVAYKPAETALLAQAAKNGCARAQGASVLLLQGVAQFEAWTNRRAPTKSMRTAVFDGTVPDLEQEQQ